MKLYKKTIEHFIDSICLQKSDALVEKGIKFDDNGECEKRFDFYDGKALEVNENNYPVPTRYGGITLKYPKLSVVNKTPEMKEKVIKVTGKTGDFDFYDIAVSLGQVSRQAMSNRQK